MDSIATSNAYIEFEQKHARHINMMSENDRNLRRQALIEFKKVSTNEKNDEIITFYYREKLCRRLVITLDDQIEKNRELSIEIITTMIERIGLKDEAQVIIPAICNRLNKTPFPETSEEVRVALIELLELCLETDKFQFLAQMGAVCGAIGRSTHDENPEMKQRVSLFASALAVAHPEKSGVCFKTTVDGLTLNLAHQHSKVRKITLKGLQDVICARNAENFI